MARAQGARAQMALAFETDYGTPPSTGFFLMPFASSRLSAEQPLLESELLGYGRDPLAPILDVETVDGDVVVPIDAEAFGVWLKATFGEPVTTGSDPYTHVFSSGAWDLPSLAIETGMPDASHFAMASGVKVESLGWQMQRSGQLQATLSLVAQGETVASESAAGTPGTWTLARFGQFNGSVSRDGNAIGNVVSAQITYSNRLDRIESIRSDGRIEGIDPGMSMLSGQIEVRFSNQALLAQAISGSASAFQFGFTRASGESFTLDVPAVYLPRPRRTIEGPQGVQVTFDWQAAQPANGDPMCSLTLVNSIAGY